MENVTNINSLVQNNTTINPALSSDNTVINQVLKGIGELEVGTVLNNEYRIVTKLETHTGEADIYICEKNSMQFVAKVYRRQMAVKDEIIKKLQDIESKFVAKVYSTGDINGFPYEIIPYYKNGNLDGKRYSYIELKKHIIPSINEGLKILHDNNIIHKDLKPSNIMIQDNNIDVAIIDFGISSVRDSNNTVLVTETGMTPEYSAPETFKKLYLAESDYYSFGITVYQLFCGRTPYEGLSAEEIEKYVSVQKLPFPDDMPDDLKNFIRGLTYSDITNRKNKKNPNRRWIYDEVKKWCDGVEQEIPGEGIGVSKESIPSYKFKGEAYTDIKKLAHALALNWNDGEKEVFRGILSGFFKAHDPEIAGMIMDTEEEVEYGADKDIAFFKLIYKLDNTLTSIIWRGYEFESLVDIGTEVLLSLRMDKLPHLLEDMLAKKVLSSYIEAVDADNINIKNAIEILENSYAKYPDDSDKRLLFYSVGYILSGERCFYYNNTYFKSINELADYMKKLMQSSYDEFSDFCNVLLDSKGKLDAQFEAWLRVMGKTNEISEWRKRFIK